MLLLALAVAYLSIGNLTDIIPASQYEDKGIYAFVPYQSLPFQVKNTSPYSRDRRMNKNKTMYIVNYRAADGSAYTWSELTADSEMGMETVKKGIPVTHRVLTIPSNRTYITVKPQETAETYTAGLRKKYIISLTLAGIYILTYAVMWCVLILIKKRKTAA